MLKLSKKVALLLIAVLLIGTGVGGYFLFKTFQIPKYFLDRYPELLGYCDTEQSGNSLKVSCKALMLDIKPNTGSPEFTSLIIGNDQELKEYTITEKEEIFAFTNDILQFKKLKPVIINLQYVKKNPITYSIQGVTFGDIPETYIQEIVNRDIEEIMGMDKSSTTILNSFDFCPRPETLPDYVIKKEDYARYQSENILSKKNYDDDELYTTEDTTIKILFGCDSQVNLGYKTQCLPTNINFNKSLRERIKTSEPIMPKWSKELDTMDFPEIKQTSLFYDGRNIILSKFMPLLRDGESLVLIKDASDALRSLIDTNSTEVNLSEEVFCGTAKLLKKYTYLPEVQEYLQKMTILFLDNIPESSTVMCVDIANNLVDSTGWYLKNVFTNNPKDMVLYNRCINLQGYIK